MDQKKFNELSARALMLLHERMLSESEIQNQRHEISMFILTRTRNGRVIRSEQEYNRTLSDLNSTLRGMESSLVEIQSKSLDVIEETEAEMLK